MVIYRRGPALHPDPFANSLTSGLQVSVGGAADGFHHYVGHLVRVHVGVGPAVFEISLLIDLYLPWDSHRCSTVGHSV